MVLAFSIFTHFSNAVLIVLCGIVLLFLMKAVNLSSKLWMSSIASLLLIVVIAVFQIIATEQLEEQVQKQETAIDSLKNGYAILKTETNAARSSFSDARTSVKLSRQELDDLQKKASAEFDKTVAEIRVVYADISDENLDRRFNAAVRKARRNFQQNVFQRAVNP